MNSKTLKRFCLLLLGVVSFIFIFTERSIAQEEQASVYRFSIREEINASAWRTTQQAYLKAEAENVDAILIEMNTFGGLINFADSIRSRILDSPIKTIVYINHNAASAGTLISLACDKIYMTRGSSIGAASVVDGEGEIMPEKYQSYMRALMRATAEATNRDPRIAEAFVDPDVDVPGLKEKGKLLSLTSGEALKAGITDGEVNSINEILDAEGLGNAVLIDHQITWVDSVIGFLTNPAVQGFLIVLIMGGIYFEMSSPGIGLPFIVALLSGLLYFTPLYIEGFAANWEILLFIIGLILLVLEIFVIPGFGIAGIAGIAFVICSFAFSMVPNDVFDFSLTGPNLLFRSFMLVIISIVGAIVLAVIFGRSIIKSRTFKRLVLEDEQNSSKGYVSSVVDFSLIDKEGIARTDLRPSGKVEIDGKWYDAVALGGYIIKGTMVTVEKHENYNLFVRQKFEV
ncbi:NfeD family protein [Albibacterium bauzanense]|uniref:Membrane-bound serine protease (ClpP class) n=1 Tax=Albibacterium bauzanense TaxID=653929 RepID=A0A4R1LU01_9SPHI|nr:NfeD family protein [Albibacterium bauzanense]TCK80739.1 membrane-bound serine protease (ClpP class) [Albibacterium bauzanense]